MTVGPFLEQKASVGFRKLRPRWGGAHAGSAPGLQALIRSGSSSQREGTRRQVRLGEVGRRQRPPQTQGQMKGHSPEGHRYPKMSADSQRHPESLPCNSGYTQTCQLPGSPHQLLNQHAASPLSRPRGNGVSVSPSRPPDPQAKPLKPVPRGAWKPGKALREAHSSQNAAAGPGGPGTGKALAVLHPTRGGVHAPSPGGWKAAIVMGQGPRGRGPAGPRTPGDGAQVAENPRGREGSGKQDRKSRGSTSHRTPLTTHKNEKKRVKISRQQQ